ncbi:deoxycytidylate deaminase [Haliovirga abyssi]|uniref:Cytidine deaminase n=1 Tax=Haliovirga abyssi TaxID=2996794 RepID=A0AAU9DG54_9FUSO|nr:dCMP deaminase family protein [Haliovirga abyssi]BDU50407.1 cytidine deaminase [Haliovirga abyssi]
MEIAILSGKRSKDPNTRVGSCIVNEKNRIVGIGYNGLPNGLNDDEFPWGNTGDYLNTKYPFVCHAELNAILNSTSISLENCKIYTALFPCNECSKVIIQSGIREVIYLSDKHHDDDIFIASRMLLDRAGVNYRKLETTIDKMELSYNEENV